MDKTKVVEKTIPLIETRESEKFKVIGQPIPLLEGKEKVTGQAQYSGDIKLDGMLHAKMLGSPHAHAMITKIDVSEAMKIPGVHDVITYEDVPQIMFKPEEARPMLILDQHIRFMGQPVAIAAAETEELAEEALKAVKVDYEVLRAVFDPMEAARPDAPQLFEDGNIADGNGKDPLHITWGDVNKGVAEADAVIEGVYRTPIQIIIPIEPRACTAYWDGNELSCWVSTQFPHRVKEDISEVLSLPFSKIKVLSKYVGGGFGGKKQEEYPILASLISMRTNRPVRMEFSREEETIVGRRRHGSVEKVRLAAKKDGTLTSIEFECYYDVGAYGNLIGGSIGFFLNLYAYKSPNASYMAYDVNVNLPIAQPFRGVALPALLFAFEQAIDQLAEKLGIDPIQMRLINTYRTGDVMPPYGAALGNFAIEECAKQAAEVSRFREKWQGWDKPVSVEGTKKRGIGVGMSMGWSDWMKHYSTATLKLFPDSHVDLYAGNQELGTGSNTALSQIVAEELGLPFENIRIIVGDTSITPNDFGACASRTIYCMGTAVQGAAKVAKDKVIEAAARKLKVKKNTIEFKEGQLFVAGQEIPLSEIIAEPISAAYQNPHINEVAPMMGDYYIGPAVFHIAEVEVDVETGQIEIVNYTAAQDVGRVINPLFVDAQVYGSMLQGAGYALLEELLYDKKTGRVLTPSFLDYKIFDSEDSPDCNALCIESSEPTGAFGAMGVGEHCLNPVAATIANAVQNAVGIRMPEAPMTPERVLKVIGTI